MPEWNVKNRATMLFAIDIGGGGMKYNENKISMPYAVSAARDCVRNEWMNYRRNEGFI